jgi:hypothetical protein
MNFQLRTEARQRWGGELVAAPVHRDLDPLMRARLADNAGGLLLVASPQDGPGHGETSRASGMLLCTSWHCAEPASCSS